jgi:RNA 2',3'-cyclic 3'-phosphodiesterase
MSRAATARLFLALDPPEEVREQLAAWARRALGKRGERGVAASRPLRVLDAELLHVTLCFLGERPLRELDAIESALAQCAVAVGELAVGAPLWLPPRHPRVLAVEVHDPSGELARLHDSLTRELAAAIGWMPAEGGGRAAAAAARGGRRGAGRRFRPHITLARMQETRPPAVPRVRELPPTPALSFTPAELVLYRSWLAPDGASYEALCRATLVPA